MLNNPKFRSQLIFQQLITEQSDVYKIYAKSCVDSSPVFRILMRLISVTGAAVLVLLLMLILLLIQVLFSMALLLFILLLSTLLRFRLLSILTLDCLANNPSQADMSLSAPGQRITCWNCLIDPSVVQQKRRIFVREAWVGKLRIVCLYTCFAS